MRRTLVALLFLVVLAPWQPALGQVLERDDAGSGRDAGTSFETAVPIETGVVYRGSLNNSGDSFPLLGDTDWFAFEAHAGQVINATVSATNAAACMWIRAPDGTEIADSGCGDEISGVVAPVDGTYALEYGYPFVDEAAYQFGVGLDAPSPLGGNADLGTPVDLTPARRPQVVVAVADSGINPYHEIYYRPEFTEHPCTWVEGFDDCSIPALELSIGEYDTFAEAYEADAETWASLPLHQWFWIPKTNIIGAVCDGTGSAVNGAAATCILDEAGHGTGTTSSVLSEAPDALLLVHQGNSGAADMATTPVVPDIQSHSWGPPAPLPVHAADPVLWPAQGFGIAGTGAFDPETIFFLAAGNEAPFPTFLDVSRVHPNIQVVGGAYPGYASARSWSAYDFASWICRPTAVFNDLVAIRPSYCGTSFAAPTAAGTAAAALLEIRRREGTTTRSTPEMVSETVSREHFLEALRAGASYTPQPGRFDNEPDAGSFPLVEGQEHLLWGYGWLDRTRVDAIVACALDDVCPAKSPEAEQYNETRQEIRHRSTAPIIE